MLRQVVTQDSLSMIAPRLSGAVTFFYYDDLPTAVRWYEDLFGFPKKCDDGWVVIFEIAGGGCIGLVDAICGHLKPRQGQDKGAIIALETPDLEDWYDRLAGKGNCQFVAHLSPGPKGLTEQFKVLDPGGYVVELFRWRQPPPVKPHPAG